jgi:RNA polymerase sigma-70 factor (ECF subfamily)
MASSPEADSPSTNPSIFLRLNAVDQRPREIAWAEFNDRYGPIIAAFARKLGSRGQDVDDLVQDVLVGFFGKSPTFVYDPARGRFRGYLKGCAYRALCKRYGKELKFKSIPLANLGEDALEIEHTWNDIWEKQQLERAMAMLRDQHSNDNSWQAFEQTVVRGREPQEVADELGVTVSAVYKARERIGDALRKLMHELQRDEG